MKRIILLIILFHIHRVNGQNRIFLKAQDVFGTGSSENINNIKLPWGNRGRYVLLRKADGTKTRYKKKEIWGIQRADKDEILRFYTGNTYKLVDTSVITIYTTYSMHPNYVFSANLGSPIISFTRKKIIKEVGEEKYIEAYKKYEIIRKWTL